MKKQFQIIKVLLFFVLLSSCETDKILLENQEGTIAKKVSLKSLNPKTNSKLFNAIEKFNNLKSNQSTSKVVYDEVSGLYIDDEKGLYVKDGEKQSYTFPVIKLKPTDKVENICFNLNKNGIYDVYLVKYEFNKEQFKNLSRQQLEQSETHMAPLVLNDIPQGFLSYVCIDVVAWVSYDVAPIDEGDLTGNFGYQGGGGAWVTIATNCSFVNTSSSSGGNSDGLGNTNSNPNSGGSPSGGSGNDIITGSVIDDIDPNNPPSNAPVGFLIDYYASHLESEEFAIFKLHPEFFSYLFNNNCSTLSQDFISSLIYGIQNNSYSSEYATNIVNVAVNNNLTIDLDDTLNSQNAQVFNSVEDFQNFINNIQNQDATDFSLDNNPSDPRKKTAHCSFALPLFCHLELTIDQNLKTSNQAWKINSIIPHLSGFSTMTEWSQDAIDNPIIYIGDTATITFKGYLKLNVEIAGHGLHYIRTADVKIKINTVTGALIDGQLILNH